MLIRTRLLLLGLTTLALPWAGWQFVGQLEGQLPEGQEEVLRASAEALARGLAARPGALPPAGPALFERPLPAPPPVGDDLVPLEVPAGTLVVLNGKLPHWSDVNRSSAIPISSLRPVGS